MFVNVVEFPPIKPGREQEFEQWFAWSNSLYEPFAGFISRRLLKPRSGEGPYLGIVEHESEETFMAMHTSAVRAEAGSGLMSSSTAS
jgi:heme-degrading monooxygenase HmoA